MGKFPTVMEIEPEDFRLLQTLKAIRQRIYQTNQNELEIGFYDPAEDGPMIGEGPSNPMFVLSEVAQLRWGGIVPYRRRRTICAVELSTWDNLNAIGAWRVYDQRWAGLINEQTNELARAG